MSKIILASQSPRRRELLKEIVDEFTVDVSKAQEDVPQGMSSDEIPRYLALVKARCVACRHYDDIVIGSDTIVVLDDMVLNKPRDEEDAYRMLRLLSGRKHSVITGCAIICRDKEHSFSEKTEVEFYDLSDKEIEGYIATKDPLDKAGAYGVQSQGKVLVKSICGDYYNVVGLPVARLKRELDEFIRTL